MEGKSVTFDEAFDRTVGEEGGYVNNPRDPGGETQWGISKREYPNVDIAALTRDDAKAIYQRDFWDKCGVSLDDAVMFQVFDASVNHGIGNAIRMLQTAVGSAPDGHWGPVSQSHYANQTLCNTLMLFLAARLEFMTNLLRFDSFGRGWSRRIVKNLRYAAQDD